MPTWRTRGLVVVFTIVTVITTLTNKYVLSILKFTYPTIFQSWQTGTMAFVLLSLHALGFIELDLSVNRHVLMSWFPGIVFFTGAIYSGSIALSRLSVPAFCSLQYGSYIMMTLSEWVIYKKVQQLLPLVCLVVSAIAAIGITRTDLQYNHMGYTWMLVHCAFAGAYMTFERSRKAVPLSDVDKIFYNTSSSIVLLMGISVLGGELYRVLEFPFLYSRDFHVGCIASGIFGAALGVVGTMVSATEYSSSVPIISSVNKVIVCGVSLLFFTATYTFGLTFCVTVSLLGGILYSYSAPHGNTNGELHSHSNGDSTTRIQVRTS